MRSTLAAMQEGHYVYTDWYQGERVIAAPDRAWIDGTWHCITTLLLTEHARIVGGFDESLIGMADTDFYLKLTTRGSCGIRLAKPLFHYRKGGGRFDSIHHNGFVVSLKEEMHSRYGGYMSCCGVSGSVGIDPQNEKLEGDVLAMALWRGNREEAGRVTGRRYPRTSFPKRSWVHPQDVEAAPHLWQRVIMPETLPEIKLPTPIPVEEEPSGLDALMKGLIDMGVYFAGSPAPPPPIRTKSVARNVMAININRPRMSPKSRFQLPIAVPCVMRRG